MLSTVQSVHTDERGEYRLFWLPPGRYYVAARVEDLQRRQVPILVFPPGQAAFSDFGASPVVTQRILPGGDIVEETTRVVYYGNALELDRASRIDLGQGESFQGADIAMSTGRARGVHIRGVAVRGESGQPAPGVEVRAIQNQRGADVFVLPGITDARGAFDLAGAVSGSYVLFAGSPAAGQADLPLQVGESDVENVRLSLDTTAEVSGRVIIEGRPSEALATDLARIRIAVTRDPDVIGMPPAMAPAPPGTPANGVVAANGRFILRLLGENGGDFRVTVSRIPADTYVKAVRMGEVNILADGLHLSGPPAHPMEVVISTDAGSIAGAAVSAARRSLPNAMLVLVPDSPALQRRFDLYRTAMADVNGQFRLSGVRPGDYRLLAFDYLEADAWQDPEFLRNHQASGTRIRVNAAAKHENIQVAAVPVRR